MLHYLTRERFEEESNKEPNSEEFLIVKEKLDVFCDNDYKLLCELTSLDDPEKIKEIIQTKIKAHQKDLKKASKGKIPAEIRNKFQQDILKNAKIILSTLQSGGFSLLKDSCSGKISHLIVDEACQGTETACLMPLQWDPAKMILVGDHKQLQATIFSDNAVKTNF